MNREQYSQWENRAVTINSLPVGTFAVDYSGNMIQIKRHEDNITFAHHITGPKSEMYANCAKVIPVAKGDI